MTELYWIRSAYTHPVEQLLILCAIMLPISLLGAGDQVVAVVAFVFGLSGLLQHANVDARSSVLSYVFATPEVHRLHHRSDDGSRANFSAFFVVMDHLFGTYRRPPRSETSIVVGLPDESGFPTDFWSQLTVPFRRQSVAAANETAPGSDRPCAGEGSR
jgi:sterol desaturase/sphingolipid hydroxylase (fatty acid hydroxylase superfamily)